MTRALHYFTLYTLGIIAETALTACDTVGAMAYAVWRIAARAVGACVAVWE